MGKIKEELDRRKVAEDSAKNTSEQIHAEKEKARIAFREKYNELLTKVINPAFKEISGDFAGSNYGYRARIDPKGYELETNLKKEHFHNLTVLLPNPINVAVYPDDTTLKVVMHITFKQTRIDIRKTYDVAALTQNEIIDNVLAVYDEITGKKKPNN